MTKLQTFIEAEQLDLDSILTEGDGLEPGDLVSHVEFSDFRGKVVEVEDGRAKVKVLDGWRGLIIPLWPVGIPVNKLEAIQ